MVPGNPLVGREAAVRRLRVAMAAVADGTGGCVLVDGPAGIGKTRLLAEIAVHAGEQGLAVARAAAAELDRIAPLSALLRALRAADPPVLDDAAIAELADEKSSRFWVLDRLGDLIEEYTATRPLLVILDDIHWADELSALALRILVPALRSSPVLWLLARRLDTGDGPTRQAVDRLAAEGADTLTLPPLAEAGIARLCELALGAVPDDALLELVRRSGGNPFLVEQLLRALLDDGRVAIDGGRAELAATELPRVFLNIVDQRLRSLSPEARRLVDAVSVVGGPVTLHEAAGLIGVPAVQLFDAAEEAVRADVLVHAGFELAFRHDIVREAVYERLPGPVRHALHREAVTVLLAESRPVTEVAKHVVRGARKGDRRAIGVLLDAAASIEQRTPDTAAGLLLRALEVMDEQDEERIRVSADAVRLLASVGRLAEARELAGTALIPGLDPTSQGSILVGLTEALKHVGEHAAVLDITGCALDRDAVPGPARAHLLAVRAHALLFSGRMDEAEAAGAGAMSAGQATDQQDAVVFGLAARTMVSLSRGEVDTAIQLARDAVGLAARAGGAAQRKQPTLWLARALGAADRFTEADALLEAGERDARQVGVVWSLPLWHFYRAELRLAAGRLDEAEVEAEAGLLVTERFGAHALAIALLGTLAQVALRRDRLPEATGFLDRARTLTSAGIGEAPEDLNWALASVTVAEGDNAAALARLAPVSDALPDRLLLFTQDPGVAPQLVRLALAAGAPAVASRAATAMSRLAARNPDIASLAGAEAHANGLLRDDRVLLTAAVRAYRSSPRVLARAAAAEDAARAEQAAGAKPAAQLLLDEALDIYGRCGAQRDHARVEQALRALGGRRGQVTRPAARKTGWDSLTEAEQRVVRLVAQGLTNRKVAAQLFLSPHTVDTHLRHAFAKLSVSTRVELTRKVMEHTMGQDHAKA
ncbi:AAA family ATPase [Kutzneria sp. NPDC051319]|uniref:helix-turn-helix transcriptional regulator n=1 Tax=Kutzneria sp. NPDC051319 TaxID=3155047 RepID=UPI003442D9CC